jgi:hypothetical protein
VKLLIKEKVVDTYKQDDREDITSVGVYLYNMRLYYQAWNKNEMTLESKIQDMKASLNYLESLNVPCNSLAIIQRHMKSSIHSLESLVKDRPFIEVKTSCLSTMVVENFFQ